MNLTERYGENIILLQGLRQYIEEGIIFSSLNNNIESFNNYAELDVIESRNQLLTTNPLWKENAFLNAFVNAEFGERIDEMKLPEKTLTVGLQLIEDKEGKSTRDLTEDFLLHYAKEIAASSGDSILAFLGLVSDTSDEETIFINRLKKVFEEN